MDELDDIKEMETTIEQIPSTPDDIVLKKIECRALLMVARQLYDLKHVLRIS